MPEQAQGAEYGIPKSAVSGEGRGETTVEVPASVADRFNAAVVRREAGGDEAPLWLISALPAHPERTPAQEHAAQSGGGHGIDLDTHKTGMEEGPDRARNLTEVTKVRGGRR